ncbi:MAG: hypothetical protein Q9184_001329 [Pyrenodesmia sp. 2 TL-2023]
MPEANISAANGYWNKAENAPTEEIAAIYRKLATIAQTTKKRGVPLQKQLQDLKQQEAKTCVQVAERVCERKGHMIKCDICKNRMKPGKECEECKNKNVIETRREEEIRKVGESKVDKEAHWFRDISKARKKPRVNRDHH